MCYILKVTKCQKEELSFVSQALVVSRQQYINTIATIGEEEDLSNSAKKAGIARAIRDKKWDIVLITSTC